ncbi:SET domain-containing protein [Coniochaeta sp. PMI_546]|nr:SET domain-containing protein [Coniochaeta sp. PMI_546]
MASPTQLESLRQSLTRDILDHLAIALLNDPSIWCMANPVLRFEAFIEDGDANQDRGSGHCNMPLAEPQTPSTGTPVVSRLLNLSGTLIRSEKTIPLEVQQQTEAPPTITEPESVSPENDIQSLSSPLPKRRSPDSSLGSPGTCNRRRKETSTLRPARADTVVVDAIDRQRQMQVSDRSFPKRSKSNSEAVFSPQESSLAKLVIGIWEQIHGGIQLDPQSMLDQVRITAVAPTEALADSAAPARNSDPDRLTGSGGLRFMTCPTPAEPGGSFYQSNTFCRKVTQASRTCRSIEVIVQARWIEKFESYVNHLATTSPSMSVTRCRKTALLEACRDFGWTEKEMRNKMRIWSGYKKIKDAGGWAALVFAGMGVYRFCKYRIDFDAESMQRLQAIRPRIEVAADTLNPKWRQLLAIVGESTERRFTGHPHDWVVFPGGSEPVPLRSTYLKYDPLFSFEHLDESLIDIHAWGGDDPRWVAPRITTACLKAPYMCCNCEQEQSDDPKLNACYCFPSLFGGLRAPSPVQVFRTSNGRHNGLQALLPFTRGAAIGEFVGLVTKDLQDVDVLDSSSASRSYQIWQGRQGNFTRFVNHSCKANAQFQTFVWMSIERIVLVSKGINAGQEITADYSETYWRGLDKQCLCGESCCRYK